MRYLLVVGVFAIFYMAYVNSDACIQCNSSNDARCAQNPDSYMAKECANASSQCYIRVLDGATIRGCASELDNATASNCRNEMECLICSYAEGCNREVFPRHRLQCIQCEGNSTSDCANNTLATPTVCPIYNLAEQCYIRSTGKNTTNSFQRGCLSSAQANKLCVKPGNCFTCEGVGCNNLQANNTSIPVARDSAGAFGASIAVLMAGLLAARFM